MGRAPHDASISEYLDSTAEPYFAGVRELLESWISHYPAAHRDGLASRLRSRDDDQFDSAFWELYLHEAYVLAGCSIEVEPSVPGTHRSPDFLIQGFDEPFYLEATSIRESAATVAGNKRLATLHEALRSSVVPEPFRVSIRHHAVGRRTPSSTALLEFLRRWLGSLDLDAVSAAYSKHGISGLPREMWRWEDWALEFMAFPGPAAPGSGVMIAWGPGEPSVLRYHEPMLRAMTAKASAYGEPDVPLVIALQANTPYHADDHHAEQALYGLHLPHPPDGIPASGTLQESGAGFWVSHGGYQRRHVPHVITASNLHIGSLASQPRVWPHPDIAVPRIRHPDLFAPVELGPARVQPALAPGSYFGFGARLTGAGS